MIRIGIRGGTTPLDSTNSNGTMYTQSITMRALRVQHYRHEQRFQARKSVPGDDSEESDTGLASALRDGELADVSRVLRLALAADELRRCFCSSLWPSEAEAAAGSWLGSRSARVPSPLTEASPSVAGRAAAGLGERAVLFFLRFGFFVPLAALALASSFALVANWSSSSSGLCAPSRCW